MVKYFLHMMIYIKMLTVYRFLVDGGTVPVLTSIQMANYHDYNYPRLMEMKIRPHGCIIWHLLLFATKYYVQLHYLICTFVVMLTHVKSLITKISNVMVVQVVGYFMQALFQENINGVDSPAIIIVHIHMCHIFTAYKLKICLVGKL